MFTKTFGTDFSEMPEGYRNILLPTLKNYYDFVLVLEKLVVHNISYNTFQQSASRIKAIDRKGKNGEDKKSLTMLEEWLQTNIHTKENITELIVKPLRNIRTLRQKPAHELTSNKYDVGLYKKQIDLMNDTYDAVRSIRLLFANHPLAKNVEVPEHLISGKGIVHY